MYEVKDWLLSVITFHPTPPIQGPKTHQSCLPLPGHCLTFNLNFWNWAFQSPALWLKYTSESSTLPVIHWGAAATEISEDFYHSLTETEYKRQQTPLRRWRPCCLDFSDLLPLFTWVCVSLIENIITLSNLRPFWPLQWEGKFFEALSLN